MATINIKKGIARTMFTDQPKLRLVKNDGAIPCSLELTNTNAIGNPNKNTKIADTPTIISVSINPVSNNSSITNYLHMQNLMTQALG